MTAINVNICEILLHILNIKSADEFLVQNIDITIMHYLQRSRRFFISLCLRYVLKQREIKLSKNVGNVELEIHYTRITWFMKANVRMLPHFLWRIIPFSDVYLLAILLCKTRTASETTYTFLRKLSNKDSFFKYLL